MVADFFYNPKSLANRGRTSRPGLSASAIRFVGLAMAAVTISCAAGRPRTGASPEETAALRPPRPPAPAEMVVQLTHANHVSALDVSADGRFLVSAGWDKTVRLWNAHTGQELRRFKGHAGVVRSVALSSDGARLATGGADAAAIIWDTYSCKDLLRLTGHTGPVTSAAFSPDTTWLATGSEDGTVRVWDARSGDEIGRLAALDSEAADLAVTPDGRHLLTGGGTSAQLWDALSGRLVRRFTGHRAGVSAVAVSADGRLALTGSLDQTARLWDVASGGELLRFEGHQQAVRSVAFCRSGQAALTGSLDGTARLWDLRDGTPLSGAIVHPHGVTAVDAPAAGSRFFTAAGEIPRGWRWEHSSAGVRKILNFEGNSDWVSSVAFSPDATRLLIGTWDDSARIWDAQGGSQRKRLFGHTGDVRGVAFSPDGRRVATAARDGTARIWDSDTGFERHRLTGHAGGIRPVVFSADGRRLATGGDDGTARIWDVQTGFGEIAVLGPHEDRVSSVAFSPDGKRLATASKQTVLVWGIESRRIVRRLDGHGRLVNSVAFSPDGNRLLTAGWDRVVRLWDLQNGDQIRAFTGHTDGVHSAVFSADGRLAASGSEDAKVRLWDADTGQCLQVLTGHTSPVIQVAISSDSRFVLSASADQTARLWDVATGRELCQMIGFRDGTWAVVDPAGRFDASNGGAVDGLHWVVGLEAIALDQLKERYYEPGLLAKKMGFNREPLRRVDAFTRPGLFPEVKTRPIDPADPRLRITLVNQGGGIGRTAVFLNGKEVIADARSAGLDPSAGRAELPPIPLSGHPYLLEGRKNVIEVRAYNAEGYLASRGITVAFTPPGAAEAPRPTLWAIVAGVSDYVGDAIDLRYAAKDAQDIAQAIRLGAARLFGDDRVRLTLLTTASDSEDSAPTRQNIEAAFAAASRARATDVILVYLAGHGVVHGGQDGDFYYLTRDARSGDLDDPAVRGAAALSSRELTEMLKQVPALKQVLILDTCASGRLVERLTEKRDIASSQVRSLERMKDRTGLYVLAGAAADAVSYETSRYGQGLLTWSLLFGMRGAALREDQFVDVGRLFGHAADHVPQIAKDIGGIQRPVIAMPQGGASFDVGQITEEDRSRIRLATRRPLLLQSSFQDEQRVIDHLKLARRVDAALREMSVRGQQAGFVYVDAAEFPDAYTIAGRYRIEGDRVKVRALLFKQGRKMAQVAVAGDLTRLDRLAADILAEIEKALHAAWLSGLPAGDLREGRGSTDPRPSPEISWCGQTNEIHQQTEVNRCEPYIG